MIAVLVAVILIPLGLFMLVFGVLLAVFHPLAGLIVLFLLFSLVFWLRRRGILRLTRPATVPRRF